MYDLQYKFWCINYVSLSWESGIGHFSINFECVVSNHSRFPRQLLTFKKIVGFSSLFEFEKCFPGRISIVNGILWEKKDKKLWCFPPLLCCWHLFTVKICNTVRMSFFFVFNVRGYVFSPVYMWDASFHCSFIYLSYILKKASLHIPTKDPCTLLQVTSTSLYVRTVISTFWYSLFFCFSLACFSSPVLGAVFRTACEPCRGQILV